MHALDNEQGFETTSHRTYRLLCIGHGIVEDVVDPSHLDKGCPKAQGITE